MIDSLSRFTVFFLLSAFLLACTQPKGNDALVSEAQEVQMPAEPAESYQVDTLQSVVTWIGSKPTGQHNGTISITSGEVGITEGKIILANLLFDIRTATVMDLPAGSEDNIKLSNHLPSPDFFHADSFPTANFELISAIPFDSALLAPDKEEFRTNFSPASLSEFMVNEPTHIITGNLTMRQTTKSVSFPAEVRIDNGRLSAEAKFNIDRTLWGLVYRDEANAIDKAKDRFIYNTVNVGFSIRANLVEE